MKQILVRLALVSLFAAGSTVLSAADTKPSPTPAQSPIPVCYACGHPAPTGK